MPTGHLEFSVRALSPSLWSSQRPNPPPRRCPSSEASGTELVFLGPIQARPVLALFIIGITIITIIALYFSFDIYLIKYLLNYCNEIIIIIILRLSGVINVCVLLFVEARACELELPLWTCVHASFLGIRYRSSRNSLPSQ